MAKPPPVGTNRPVPDDDLVHHEATLDGEGLDLAPKEFELSPNWPSTSARSAPVG